MRIRGLCIQRRNVQLRIQMLSVRCLLGVDAQATLICVSPPGRMAGGINNDRELIGISDER